MKLIALFLLCAGITMATEQKKTEQATFAGGCFWCMQSPFTHLPGVISSEVGYMGGTEKNPTYDDYAQKNYKEVIHVIFDPLRISYDQLLDVFWKQINPTDAQGQFADRGPQYSPAIFYHTDAQKKKAKASKKAVAASKRFDKPITTEILPASHFYTGEEYHQKYAEKNPAAYKQFRQGSGRDQFLEKVWKNKTQQKTLPPETKVVSYQKPADPELKKNLTPMAYNVTQQCGTEPAFQNAYYNNKEKGIYVDVVTGEPLFSSHDKYDSGTGWPSFTKPLDPKVVVTKKEEGLFGGRTEVKSATGKSHLGHVFNDGPSEKGGLRYCINSAALRFIPVRDLEKEGYGHYRSLFE